MFLLFFICCSVSFLHQNSVISPFPAVQLSLRCTKALITLQILRAEFTPQLHPKVSGVCNPFLADQEKQRAINCCPNCGTDGQADVPSLCVLINLINALSIWLRKGETLHSPEWELGIIWVFFLKSPTLWCGCGGSPCTSLCSRFSSCWRFPDIFPP